MNTEKTLRRLHWLTIAVFAVFIGNSGSTIPYGRLSVFLLLLGLAGATLTSMFLVARSKLGSRYAKKNLILAILFSFAGGLGVLFWPYLVRTEIRKVEESH